jgi:hypothetical protein
MADSAAYAGASQVAKIAMSQRKKKTDVVEPQVIDEHLLREGVEEPLRPDGELTDPIDFPKVTSLRLSFLNIIEISNLNNFDSLTTLRLDNNIIDKMEHLGHLKTLTWLDLSFNNIKEIEGLEDLTNLTDLSLYHNQIEEIKGLDGCMKLNILSLGFNNIRDLKQIDYLRKFQNLRCVCLEGNKICTNDSYQLHVLAYLTNLRYLDYMLIEKKAAAQAMESYQLDELTELKEREAVQTAQTRAEQEKKAILEKLKAAFQDCTEDLFEELFSPTAVPENLTVLQCYPALKEDYKDKLAEEVKILRGWLDDKNTVRKKKVESFERVVREAEAESEAEAKQLVKQFKSLKKKVLEKLDDSMNIRAEQMIQQLLEELTSLEQHLMANEIQLQESLEEAIDEFEVVVSEMIKVMAERGSDFFRRFEELEKVFFTGLLEGAQSEMESFAAQNQDLTEHDARKAQFLQNREEMLAACTNFNEAHIGLIQTKDDYMQSQMNGWMKNFFEQHRDRQYHRNRQRIMEIKQINDECREEIMATEAADYEAGDEDGGGERYHRG